MKHWFISLLILLVAASAQAQNLGGTHDSDQPIEITADALEVLQKDSVAVFSGNVVAVQGKMKLTSNKMTVHYRNAEQSKGGGGAQGVSRIEVEGNVFLATPDESAKSRTGVYDVDASQINLRDDVVLTRGENVVKGSFLTYDLVSGKSKITGAGVTVNPQTGKTEGQKGRVRGLFVPESQ